MSTFLLIDLDKDNLDITIRELLLSKVKKPDEMQQTLPSEEKKPTKYLCNNPTCKKEITKDVVAYCLHEENKSRFGGKVFCRDCQKAYKN